MSETLTDEEIQWVKKFKKDCEDFCERYEESTAAWKSIQGVLLDFRKAVSKRERGIPLTDYELKLIAQARGEIDGELGGDSSSLNQVLD